MRYLIMGMLLIEILCGFSSIKQVQKKHVLLKAIERTYEGDTKKGLANGVGIALGEQDRYEGKFKKGYPHGEGVYIWGNGDKYIGRFFKGKMNGLGKLIIKQADGLADSIVSGYFEKGIYKGKFKEPFKVNSSSSIRNIDFQKNDNVLNRVKFMFYSNGKVIDPTLLVDDMKNTRMEEVSGCMTMVDVSYPLEKINVSFSEKSFNYQFNFSLYEKGNWTIVVSL